MKTIYTMIPLFLGLLCFTASGQEFHMPAPSPHVEIHQAFSTSFIKLDYSRPSKNGRKVFGALIPFDQVWRTGANATTKITFGEEVSFGGEEVEPGEYALYTIPGKTSWQVILNKGVDNWGADGFDAQENLVKIDVPVQELDQIQESFSLSLESLSKDKAVLRLDWDNTRIDVPIVADNDARIMAYLQEQLQKDQPPYMQVAGYYLQTNRKLEDALEYVNAAIAANPQYYMHWTKAQILEKLDRHTEALEAAKTAVEVARKEHPAFVYEYERNYENLRDGKLR